MTTPYDRNVGQSGIRRPGERPAGSNAYEIPVKPADIRQKALGGAANSDWASNLEGDQRDAFAALSALFASYGLQSLAPKIFDYVKQGYGADTISLLLQDTAEYKSRFSGNEARRQAGLPVLTPAQYLATESAYRQVLSSAGLPVGFYDTPQDFTDFISRDISPTELKDRADEASRVMTGQPELRQAMKDLYGVSDGDIAAYFINPQRAEPILRQREQAAEIAAQGIARGFGASQNAERFAQQGITAAQAAQGYGLISETYQPLQQLAQIYGTTWTQGEAELATFEPGSLVGTSGQQPGAESASAKQKRLASQERAAFAGRSFTRSGSLGQNTSGK